MLPTMHHKAIMVQSLILTIATALLCAALFCGLFYLIPLENRILTVFANITLGLSVFCGAFFAAARTRFFRLGAMLFLPFCVLLLLFAGTLTFGIFDAGVFLQKTALVLVAAILGEIAGRR
jgi:putative membrane protein (TIGR04086 family)